MKLQFSVYDAIFASLILIIFYVILYYSIPLKLEFEKKYLEFLSYDILFAIDKLYKIDINYKNLFPIIQEILISKLQRAPNFYFENYGLLPNEINISCICDEDILRTLNNIYRNVEINGRNININFFPTTFPLTRSDFENHGLIIFGCKDLSGSSYYDLLRYREVNGILLICDINSTYFSNNQPALSSIFNLSLATNNGNSNANLIKPLFGFSAPYKAYKILKYQFDFSDTFTYNLLTSDVVVKPNNYEYYLFKQQNSDVAAITLSFYKDKVIGWSVNFYRDGVLDLTEQKILLSLILSITSLKEPIVPEKAKDTLIPYISFNYKNFLEPFIVYFSIY